MSNTIQVKRGANASLSTLNAGEFGFSTDTYQVYIGDGATNHEIVLISKLTTVSGDLQTQIDTKIANVSEDSTPELGGDLGCGGYNLDNIGKYCAISSATSICNQTGSTLTKGTAVTISGLSGETCCVIKSDNRELDKTPSCGVVYADITNGNIGCMITLGRITMDTSGMTGTEGDRLYVQSDGSLDTATPTSGAVQRIGFLIKKAAGSAGRVCVCIRGRKSIYSAKDEHPIIRMGSEADHTKIEFRDYTNNEILTVDSSGNLTLSGTVDSVDVATLKSDYDGHTHGDIYYTETEIDTWRASTTVTEMGYVHGVTSGVQTQIDAKAATSLAAAPGADHTAEGPQTNDINAGEAVTVIDCVYLKSDGEWWKTDADAVATAEGMLAISLESKTNGQAMNVALPGSFIRDDTWTWTVGDEIYLSCTVGALTQTAPSGANNVVRVIGHATHTDRMFFNPDQTIVVHV